MPTQTLLPDALLAHAGWAGSPVIATIDEDPDTAGGDWLDPATQSTDSTARVGFPTPSGPPSGVQTFKARLGLVDALGTSPTARIDLFEAGVLKASGAEQTISSTKALGGEVISQTFDLATTPLTTADGSAVEALVVVTASGGSKTNIRSASLDSVNWDIVNYTAPETVANYRLGESSGTTAADETARYPGTYVGGPLLGQPGLRAGDANTAVSFDGLDDKVSIPSNAAFDLTTGRTVKVLVRADDLTRRQMLVGRSGGSGPNSWDWGLDLLADKRFHWWVYNGSTAGEVFAGVASGAVQHLVGTHDGAVMRLYVNGVEAGSLASTVAPNTATQPVTLGGEGDFNFFKGVLQHAVVYNYALTAAQVLEDYQAGTGPAGVNGAGSPLLGTVSATAAGKVDVAGSGSGTLGALASSGAAKAEVAGSGATTLPTPSSSGTGQVAVSGSLTRTLAVVTGSGTGTIGSVPVSGSGSPTLGTLASTGAGAVEVRGAGTTALAGITASGAGKTDIAATGSPSLAVLTSSGTGAVGSVPISGSGSPVLGSLSSTGAGKAEVRGAGSGVLGALTALGVGKAEVRGSGAGSLGGLSSSGTAKVEVKGSGGALLGSVTSTSTGQVAVRGSGTGTLATASLSATGAIGTVSGSGTSTLAVLTSIGTAKAEVRGSGSAGFTTLTGSGAARAEVSATGAADLVAFTATSTGGVAVSGFGSSAFATLTTTSSATVSAAASGAPSLGSVWSAGAGTVAATSTYVLLTLAVAHDVELALGARSDTALVLQPRPDAGLTLSARPHSDLALRSRPDVDLALEDSP